MCIHVLSHVCLFVTPWTVARQAPLSTEFSRQEYWRGLPFPTPEDLPKPGIKPVSLAFPALAGRFFTTSATWEAQSLAYGTPLQYSCLENPMDKGAWKAAVHVVTKSWTGLSDFTFTFHFHELEKEMATHSSVLAWRITGGWGSLVGCRLWGRTESDTPEAT